MMKTKLSVGLVSLFVCATMSVMAQSVLDGSLLKETGPNDKDRLYITVKNVATPSLKDQIAVYFQNGATNAFDPGYDALKFPPGDPNPKIWTLDLIDSSYSINGLPMLVSDDVVVRMHLQVKVNGAYEILAEHIADFDPTTFVYLEDLKTGMIQDLRLNSTYSFTANTADNYARFLLRFTPPASIQTHDVGCIGTDGSITINQPGNHTTWDYTVTNSAGGIVGSGQNFMGVAVLENMSRDEYTVSLTNSTEYTIAQHVVVDGVTPVSADFSASATEIMEGGHVEFSSLSSGATGLEWEFGDGAFAADVNHPVHTYKNEGIYEVKLSVSNGECTDSKTASVAVKKAEDVEQEQPLPSAIGDAEAKSGVDIYAYNGNTISIVFHGMKEREATVNVMNILGQRVMDEQSLAATGRYDIQLSQQASGYYIVQVAAGADVYTRKVLVTTR